MWGTDWQRVRPVLTLDQGVRYLTESDELGESERQLLLGATLRRIYRWASSDETS